MLYQIVLSFGFSSKECTEFVEQLSLQENTTSSPIYQGDKIILAKQIVHKCIHKLSGRIFSQKAAEASFPGDAVPLDYRNSLRLVNMPLSIRTVYILFHLIEFSETEIGYILNINTLQVKERLGRAALIITKSSA